MKMDVLTPALLHRMDAYWCTSNYLSVGQILHYDNPLLREPLKLLHVKPTVFARITHEELDQLVRGYGWTPIFVEGDEPEGMHQRMAGALDQAVENIIQFQADA